MKRGIPHMRVPILQTHYSRIFMYLLSLLVIAQLFVTVLCKGFRQDAVQAQKGSRGIALLTPNLGSRWGWLVNATPQILYPLETALVPIGREVGWAPRLAWKGIEKRKSHAPPGFEPQIFQPVTSHYIEFPILARTLLCNLDKLLELIMLVSVFFILCCVYTEIFNKDSLQF
jgi:hypothetical protein